MLAGVRLAPATLCLLGVVLCVETVVGVCPSGCRCGPAEASSDLLVVDCSHSGLEVTPDLSELGAPVHRLDLSGNHISSVPEHFLPGHSRDNVSDILLEGNQISRIHPHAFRGLSQIQRLSLRRNALSTVEAHTFKGVSGVCVRGSPQTCTLDLTDNPLARIEGNAFAFVKNVRILLGRGGGDLEVDPYAFYGVANIAHIHIDEVGRLTLRPGAFTNSEWVSLLEVSNTTLTSIGAFTFQGLTHVNTLHIHHSVLPDIKDYAFAGIHYEPSPVDPPQAAVVSSMGAPSNVISETPGGGVVKLESCDIQLLAADSFRDTNLARLQVKESSIRHIAGHMLRGASRLRSVQLTDNLLPPLISDSFGSVTGLKQLHLDRNDLRLIRGNAFRDLEDVGVLSIRLKAGSHLTLERHAFSGALDIANLQILGESSSKAPPTMTVAEDAFANLVGVRNLDIVNVKLPVLQRHTFRGMGKVHSLRFVSCNITHIESKTFGPGYYGPGAVDSLDLSRGNHLQCNCDTTKLLQELGDVFLNVTLTCVDGEGVSMTTTYNSRRPDTMAWPVCATSSSDTLQHSDKAHWMVIFTLLHTLLCNLYRR